MLEKAANNQTTGKNDGDLAFIWKSIGRIDDCMLVTRDKHALRSRPMRGLARENDNAIWFFTSKSSHKDDEIAVQPEVCLSYCDSASKTYVSLSGRIEITDDARLIADLWNPGAQAYFPAGPHDPDVALLKFTPASGEYWDAPSNPVLLAIQFIKAKVTGDKLSLGENAKVAMG